MLINIKFCKIKESSALLIKKKEKNYKKKTKIIN